MGACFSFSFGQKGGALWVLDTPRSSPPFCATGAALRQSGERQEKNNGLYPSPITHWTTVIPFLDSSGYRAFSLKILDPWTSAEATLGMKLRGEQNKMKGKGRFLLHSPVCRRCPSWPRTLAQFSEWGCPQCQPGLKEENTKNLTTALVCEVLTSLPVCLHSLLFRGLESMLWVFCPGLRVVISGRNGLGGLWVLASTRNGIICIQIISFGLSNLLSQGWMFSQSLSVILPHSLLLIMYIFWCLSQLQ